MAKLHLGALRVVAMGFGTMALMVALGARAQAAPRQTSPAPAATPERGSNLLVISVDALRRDHLGAYGYPRATTPRIDALLAESVVFDNAYAPIARSLPAHVSLWTAAWPHRHGVIGNAGLKTVFASGPKLRSSAELLKDAGLRPTAFVGSYLLGAVGGLNAGFEFVDEPARTDMGAREIVRTSAETAERASRWLSLQRKANFVLWTHFEAPGEPNDPPPALVELFRGDGHAGKLVDALGVEPQRYQLGYSPLLLIRMFFPELEGCVTPTADLALPSVERSTLESMFNRYDAEVRSVDGGVGALLDRLSESGLAESTTVVFVGAYGHSLGERMQLGGGETTLESTRVPMAIRWPKSLAVQPRRVDAFVSTIDLLPTALARTHPAVAAKLVAQADGRDVLAEGFARGFVLSQRTRRDNARNDPGPMYAWRTPEWTYVVRPQLTDYCFDRVQDPLERDNLLMKQPERAAELAERARAAFGLK